MDEFPNIPDAVSPRNWHGGISAHWIIWNLDWDNAIIRDALTVTPEPSYGSSVNFVNNPMGAIK